MIDIHIDKYVGTDLDADNYTHLLLEDRYGETSPKGSRKVLGHEMEIQSKSIASSVFS